MKRLTLSAIAIVVGIALIGPQQALGAWPESAFEANSVADAMNSLFGTADNTPSGKIQITAPDSVKAGTPVAVTVTTRMQASAIAIIVEHNNQPLAANIELSDSAKGFGGVSIELCATSDIVAVIRSGGKLFTARRNVKVTGGDCAGAGKPRKSKTTKSIRMNAVAEGGEVTVEAKIMHRMESGLRKNKKTGDDIAAHYITEVTGVHNGKTIVTAQWGPYVSANPKLSFKFAGAKKGDRVTLSWVDNKGQSDSSTARIK